MQIKIYYHHTDCGGVVYYAKYLEFLEEARTEFLNEKGVSVKELADKGVLFVVARQEIDYKCPAVYGDTLSINACLAEIGRVKLIFTNEIKNQKGQLICAAKTVMVCVSRELKPQAIPEEILNKLSA